MTTVHDIGDAFGTDDESDAYFIASAERWGAKLKAENPDLVWIDPAPEWISDADWIDTIGALIRPPATGNTYRAVMRLMLPGGSPRDEVRITVEYERCDDNLGDWVTSWTAQKTDMRVTLFEECGARRLHSVRLKDARCEMRQAGIVGAPEPVAERLVRLIREIADALAPTWGLMSDPRSLAEMVRVLQPHRADRLRCISCDRPLRDEVSKAIGIGPDCAAGLGIKHSLSTAHAMVKRATQEQEVAQ